MQCELNRLVALNSRGIDVDIWRKLDFSNQANPATGDHSAIGLCKGQPKMRRFDILAHFLGQFRENPSNDIVRRESVRVLGFEILFANNAARVDIEESGVRHPFGHPFRFCVENAEAPNDLGIRICKQRKLDFVPVSEVLQDSRTIVANRSQLDSLSFKSLFGVLQLHELRFTAGSPIGGSEEEENSAARSSQRLV